MTKALSPARLAFGVLVVALACFAWLDATAAAMYRINPDLVLKIKPGDPRSLNVAVDRRTLSEGGITQPSPQEAAALREALLERPLSVSILRQLAMAEQIEARTPHAARLLDISNRISRRDLLTELLLSERAARANRPVESLRHFDAALSTNAEASSLMFGPLARTLEQPDFRPYVARHLDRPWGPAFLDAAVRTARSTDLLATVVQNPAVQQQERFRRFRGDLISRLVNEGYPALAFEYAAKGPEAEAAPIKVVGFTRATTDARLGPLLWRMANAGGVYSSLSGSTVVVDVDPASTGNAVERLFALPPGSYALAASTRVTDHSENLSADWQVACLARGKARLLARSAAPLGSREGAVRAPFRIDESCQAVRIALVVHNLDDQRDAEIEITHFAIEKPGA